MRFLFIAACLALPVHAQQVYRCQGPGGQTVFQQTPCTDGAKIEVKPTNSVAAEKPQPIPARQAVAAPAPAAAAAAMAPAQTDLESAADRCLDWYRPRLRDPRGAYQRDAKFDKTVLHLTIYATNGFGGYVSKAAACEFKGDQIDASWSQIHATRLRW